MSFPVIAMCLCLGVFLCVCVCFHVTFGLCLSIFTLFLWPPSGFIVLFCGVPMYNLYLYMLAGSLGRRTWCRGGRVEEEKKEGTRRGRAHQKWKPHSMYKHAGCEYGQLDIFFHVMTASIAALRRCCSGALRLPLRRRP